MKPLASLAFVCALSLASVSACSSEGGTLADFCVAAASLGSESEFELADLSDGAMEAALAGDMSEVNAWGEASADTIAELSAQVEFAKGGAPTDEVATALDDVAEALGLMGRFANTAADAPGLPALLTAIDDLGTDLAAVDAKLTEAGDVVDAAEEEYCS